MMLTTHVNTFLLSQNKRVHGIHMPFNNKNVTLKETNYGNILFKLQNLFILENYKYQNSAACSLL